MSVVVLHTPAELAASEALLEDLAAHAAEPNVFFEGWFLRAALNHLREPHQQILLALVQSPEGAPLALFPTQMSRRSVRSPFRRASLWLHRHCFLGTPLVRAGSEVAAFTAYLSWMRAYQPRVSLLTLPSMTADGPVHQAILTALRREGLPFVETVRYERAFQPTGISADEHFDRLTKRMRKELKRKERRLEDCGSTELRSLSAASDLASWGDAFLSMEASGWKGRAQSALQTNPADLAFFRELLAESMQRQKLAMTLLQIGDKPAAGTVSFVSGVGVFAFKIAYDEQFAHVSPGSIATLYTLQTLLPDSRIRWIDSSAAPNHPLLDKIYLGRRTIVTLEVGLHGAVPLRLVNTARQMYRAYKRRPPPPHVSSGVDEERDPE